MNYSTSNPVSYETVGGSLDPLDGLLALRNGCMSALTCLYLAVDKRIADDVKSKVMAYVRELEKPKQPIESSSATDGR